MVALGQNITVPQGNFLQASLLAASSFGPVSGTATVHYTDGSTSTARSAYLTGTLALLEL